MKKMNRSPLAQQMLLCAVTALSACTIEIGPLDESDATAEDMPPGLPEPPGREPVPLDEAKRAKQAEVDRYISSVVYRGATITHTIQLPSGDIIDGLDRDTLPSLPYALPLLPWAQDGQPLPPGVEPGLFDFQQYPELLDLITVAAPFVRPDFSAYIQGETYAVSLEDYLDRYQEGGTPRGNERLYAGLISGVPNRGAAGLMNQFHPKVPPGTFSLIEFAVFCPRPEEGPAEEVVGVVISVDKVNAVGRGGEPRLHVEYARRTASGEVRYRWDETDGQFQANPFRRHRPGQVVPVSELAGKQVEHLMGVFQHPLTGDWWVGYDGELLGYFPARLFKRLNAGACGAAWYGEVFTPRPEDDATHPEMGSGEHGSAGPLLAAYVRNPLYLDRDAWVGQEPIGRDMVPQVEECYSRTELEDRMFYLGGDGADDPRCIWPSP